MNKFSVVLTGEVGRSDVGEALRVLAEQGITDVTELRLEHFDIHIDGQKVPATRYIVEVDPA